MVIVAAIALNALMLVNRVVVAGVVVGVGVGGAVVVGGSCVGGVILGGFDGAGVVGVVRLVGVLLQFLVCCCLRPRYAVLQKTKQTEKGKQQNDRTKQKRRKQREKGNKSKTTVSPRRNTSNRKRIEHEMTKITILQNNQAHHGRKVCKYRTK